MINRLKDVPEPFGNIDGVDMDVDINVKVTTHPKLRADIESLLKEPDAPAITLDKEYHVHKITGYGDPFDVWITNDKGEEEELAEWIFEDIND